MQTLNENTRQKLYWAKKHWLTFSGFPQARAPPRSIKVKAGSDMAECWKAVAQLFMAWQVTESSVTLTHSRMISQWTVFQPLLPQCKFGKGLIPEPGRKSWEVSWGMIFWESWQHLLWEHLWSFTFFFLLPFIHLFFSPINNHNMAQHDLDEIESGIEMCGGDLSRSGKKNKQCLRHLRKRRNVFKHHAIIWMFSELL